MASVLAIATLTLHLLWILWVIFGALVTRGRPALGCLHIASLVWGVLVEVTPWPCPLTLAENHFEAMAGENPYTGGFLLHYLDRLVYPDVSGTVLMWIGVAICVTNLSVYVVRWRRAR